MARERWRWRHPQEKRVRVKEPSPLLQQFPGGFRHARGVTGGERSGRGVTGTVVVTTAMADDRGRRHRCARRSSTRTSREGGRRTTKKWVSAARLARDFPSFF